MRPMRWWDIPAALEIERGLFPDPWSAETFWAELAGVPETRYYVVAEFADRIVGYAGLFATREQADIETIAVSASCQGQGVGSSLLRSLLRVADDRGCRDVLLEVRADNPRAQHLYEAHGFHQISVRRGYYQPGSVDGLVLRRRAR